MLDMFMNMEVDGTGDGRVFFFTLMMEGSSYIQTKEK
jgi:hypothetical protein